jgi:hypothetical protein
VIEHKAAFSLYIQFPKKVARFPKTHRDSIVPRILEILTALILPPHNHLPASPRLPSNLTLREDSASIGAPCLSRRRRFVFRVRVSGSASHRGRSSTTLKCPRLHTSTISMPNALFGGFIPRYRRNLILKPKTLYFHGAFLFLSPKPRKCDSPRRRNSDEICAYIFFVFHLLTDTVCHTPATLSTLTGRNLCRGAEIPNEPSSWQEKKA